MRGRGRIVTRVELIAGMAQAMYAPDRRLVMMPAYRGRRFRRALAPIAPATRPKPKPRAKPAATQPRPIDYRRIEANARAAGWIAGIANINRPAIFR